MNSKVTVLAFIFMVYGIVDVYCQPTIKLRDWLSSRENENQYKKLQTTMDFILLELKRQTHENKNLKIEIMALQNQTSYQEEMLSNLTEKLNCPCKLTQPEGTKELNRLLEVDIFMDKKDNFNVTEESKITRTTQNPITEEQIQYPKDCEEIWKNGSHENKTYMIQADGASYPFMVVCEMHQNEAWTIIQRRLDGSVDFYRGWKDYKNGFGSLNGEFWLGNENIHFISTQASYKLRIDMWDWKRRPTDRKDDLESNYFFAESDYFFIRNETNYYELNVPEDFFAYRGYGGSGLRVHAGPFVTYDLVPPSMRGNCATKFHCGWWFTTCVRNANLNGRYYKDGYKVKATRSRAKDDIYWPNIPQSLRAVTMKLQRVE